MKNYGMFKYDFLFGDHFAKASPKAKLLYINLSFYADCGFVANPKQICKSMGYDDSVLQELISIDELLTIEGRAEMFITSYFVHNPNFKSMSWLDTPFGEYWKGKMWMKKNRIATFKHPKLEQEKEKDKESTDEEETGKIIRETNLFDPELNDMINKLHDSHKN